MLDDPKGFLQWVKSKWGGASSALRLVYLFVSLAIIALLAAASSYLVRLNELFVSAHPVAQSAVLICLVLMAFGTAIYSYDRNERVRKLKEEAERHRDELAAAKKIADDALRDAKQLEERWDRLSEVESREVLWQRPCGRVVPKFIDPHQRKTRFLAILNLKGGVGKTTLCANLAATAALADKPLRVLLLDIDFQKSLSDVVIDPQLIDIQARNKNTVSCLLTQPDDEFLLNRLTVTMNQVPGARVVISDDGLEGEDFRLQAQFFVDPLQEVRFFFREHLHKQKIFDEFDLVVFDCPPRLTTSAVNALACSDFVLIPTKLDSMSVNAVPRTIQWLANLSTISRARLLGVVANQTAHRSGGLTKADQNSYSYLRQLVAKFCPGPDLVFKVTVKADSKAVPLQRGVAPAVDPEIRVIFEPFVSELRSKLQL